MKRLKTSKRTTFLVISALFLLLFSLVILVSCGGDDEEEDTSSTLVLNVYNWGEYISDGSLDSYDTNKEFEKYYYETFGRKVKVNYTTYATNEDMYAKLKGGAGSYDIVVPSDYMIEKMIREDMLLPIDTTKIENYENISEDFLDPVYDPIDPAHPDQVFSVPYTYGVVGIIYNNTMVDPEDVAEESWGLLWNEKYRGKILQFNNPRDGFATAMYYKNIDVNSDKEEDWDRALELMKQQKPLVQSYVSDEIFNKMISGSAAIGVYYAGDYITMYDKNDALRFYYPTEGTNIFVDAMCIPKSSKNPELAQEYINFMLSEEAAVANAIYIGYASPNKLVKENEDYIDEMSYDPEEYENEEDWVDVIGILYGDTEQLKANYDYDPAFRDYSSPELEQYVFGLWEELKTENATEPWVHITAALIVLALGGGFGYSFYLRKKRSHDYRMRDKERAAQKKATAAQNSGGMKPGE